MPDEDCPPLPAKETKHSCLMNEMLGFKFLGKTYSWKKSNQQISFHIGLRNV